MTEEERQKRHTLVSTVVGALVGGFFLGPLGLVAGGITGNVMAKKKNRRERMRNHTVISTRTTNNNNNNNNNNDSQASEALVVQGTPIPVVVIS